MALFQDLNRQGMTVLIVTDEPDVATFASRVVRFRDGKVLSDTRQAPMDAAKALGELVDEVARGPDIKKSLCLYCLTPDPMLEPAPTSRTFRRPASACAHF